MIKSMMTAITNPHLLTISNSYSTSNVLGDLSTKNPIWLHGTHNAPILQRGSHQPAVPLIHHKHASNNK